MIETKMAVSYMRSTGNHLFQGHATSNIKQG